MTSTASVITEDTIRSHSQARGEPAWLLQRRLDALRAFDAMEMPAPYEEEWRRTDLRPLDLDAALQTLKAPVSASPPAAPALADEAGYGAVLVQNDGITARSSRSAGLPEGVLLEDLRDAAAKRDFVQSRLHSLVTPTEWKFQALQAALWQGGALIYVPRNVEVELPLRYAASLTGGMLASHLLIIAEENSSVTVVQDDASADGGTQAVVLGAVEIFAAQDARVRYVETQRWGNNVWNFSTIRARLERGAQFTGALVGLGSRLTKTRLDAMLAGEASSAELLGLIFGNEERHFDFVTLQEHIAPRTRSDLLFKAALTDKSKVVWNGTVRVEKGASQAEANQTSRNLLLSDTAKAAPIPILEIEAFDVLRCSHGASAGPVDPEYRFYLESRGIPPAETERLLIEGFLREVLDRIPVEAVRESIDATLIERLEGLK